MRAFIIFYGGGSILILSTYKTFYHAEITAGLKANGIKKFIAYEVDLDLCRERYDDHFDFISKYLGAKDDFRVLDYNGNHIFDTFSFEEMKETFKVTF
ncbi:MAG: hypothetical protein KJ621_09450 [Proteobacteria bacterium]|nr:hypothetical protein [Pseudomonadota bacterium]